MIPHDGGPAFPGGCDLHGYGEGRFVTLENGSVEWLTIFPGMSLRDYIATKAMASLLANVEMRTLAQLRAEGKGETLRSVIAAKAYQYADVMLEARKISPSAEVGTSPLAEPGRTSANSSGGEEQKQNP